METFTIGDRVTWSADALQTTSGQSVAARLGSGPFEVLNIRSASVDEVHLAMHTQMLTVESSIAGRRELSGFYFTHV